MSVTFFKSKIDIIIIPWVITSLLAYIPGLLTINKFTDKKKYSIFNFQSIKPDFILSLNVIPYLKNVNICILKH